MGALVVNPDKAPVPTQQIMQDFREIIPLLSVPCMVHRFHANRAMKETSDKVSAFQLEVSGRTEGSRKVWHVLEILSNCSVLQTSASHFAGIHYATHQRRNSCRN